MGKLLGAFMLVPILAAAQDLIGDWTALLHYSAQMKDKSVTLHFSQARNGRLSGNLRGSGPVFLIPIDAILIRDGRVSFHFSTGSVTGMVSPSFDPLAGVTVKGSFEGILDASGAFIHGLWTQTEPLPFRPIEVDFRRTGTAVTRAAPRPAPPLPGFDPLPSAPVAALPYDLMERLEARVRQELTQVSDYTCIETIDRSRKLSALDVDLRPLDRVRLEILTAPGGQELYASPGDTRWEPDLSKLVDGMTGNGAFVSFMRNILLTGDAQFTYRDLEDLGGRSLARFDFTLPASLSGWDVSVDGGAGRVGMKGSIWVDPEGPDLRRVEVRADQIPAALPIDGLVILLSYGRTTIGDRSVMIPDAAVMHLREKSGRENLNAIEFTHCRAFHAESAVRFEPSPQPDVRPPAPPTIRQAPSAILPAGLPIAIRLTTPITDQTAVGSFIEGEVSGNVTASGAIPVRDGAKVQGRVRRLERYSSKEGSYFIVALEFTDLDSARFFADFVNVDRAQGVAWSKTLRLDGASGHAAFGNGTVSVHWETIALPGVGAFIVRGSNFTIPAGFRMIWKTRSFSDYD